MARPRKTEGDQPDETPAGLPLADETAPEAVAPVVAQSQTVTVTARKESFWRCGRQFSRTPVVLNVDELAAGELETLRTEPWLTVT